MQSANKDYNGVIALILTICIALCSGSAIATTFSIINNLCIILASVFAICFVMQRYHVVSSDIFVLIVLVFQVALTFFITEDTNVVQYLQFGCNIVVGYSVAKKIKFCSFVQYYQKFMTVISAVSLIGFILVNNTSVLNALPRFSNSTGAEYAMSGVFNWLIKQPERNCGFFWEPGVYATFICWGIVFELLFPLQKASKIRLAIYSLTLFTINSSAGYAIFAMCFILLLVRNKEYGKSSVFKIVISTIIVICAVMIIENIDAIIVASGLVDNQYISKLRWEHILQSERWMAFDLNLVHFVEHPFVGEGFTRIVNQITHYADTSTITYLMSVFGLLGVEYGIMWIYGILKQRKLSVYSRMVLIIIVLSMLNKEPHHMITFSWIMLFYLANEDIVSEYQLGIAPK